MNQTEETYSGDSYWYHEDILNVTVSNSTSVFQSPLSPLVDKAISCITIIILFITMVSLGCTMEISKIKAHILKPKGVAIAVVAQYGIMPLTAFTLAKVFQLGSIESVTVLICGCCPGGNLSNIFALALKGDMNLRALSPDKPERALEEPSRACEWSPDRLFLDREQLTGNVATEDEPSSISSQLQGPIGSLLKSNKRAKVIDPDILIQFCPRIHVVFMYGMGDSQFGLEMTIFNSVIKK
ncbi:UNVERIFIED_CONTAM: hypothetical protein FKN15_072510 [Acipenser sinensis]